METNEITEIIVDSAVRLHIALGPGLLESVYERSLEQRGLAVQRQMPVGFDYDGMHFEDAFRIDLLVEDRVVVELKSVESIQRVHYKQLLTYVKLLNRPCGLLLNFGDAQLKDGIRRIINTMGTPGDLGPSGR